MKFWYRFFNLRRWLFLFPRMLHGLLRFSPFLQIPSIGSIFFHFEWFVLIWNLELICAMVRNSQYKHCLNSSHHHFPINGFLFLLFPPSLLFFLKQMVMSLRVSELQVLLGYAGRNKHGRKHELLTKALHLLKAGCSPAVQMKIKELYRRRFPQKIVTPTDLSLSSVHATSASMTTPLSPSAIPQLSYDGHATTSPLLAVSLLGPKHELDLPHLTSSLHPVHPDVKLQKLPFYDILDELIKPTSLGKKQVKKLL